MATAACSTSPGAVQLVQQGRRLNAAELDLITAGNALARSDGFAQALGERSTASSSSNDASIDGGSLIAGAPFTNYAASQADGDARGVVTTQATVTGTISVGNGPASVVGAQSEGAANAANPGATAKATLQVYGVSIANGTNVVFGSVGANACCVPGAEAMAKVDLSAAGRYVRSQQTREINPNPSYKAAGIDFAVVSSALPITDPSRAILAAAPARF